MCSSQINDHFYDTFSFHLCNIQFCCKQETACWNLSCSQLFFLLYLVSIHQQESIYYFLFVDMSECPWQSSGNLCHFTVHSLHSPVQTKTVRFWIQMRVNTPVSKSGGGNTSTALALWTISFLETRDLVIFISNVLSVSIFNIMAKAECSICEQDFSVPAALVIVIVN